MRNVKHYVFVCVYVCIYDEKESRLSPPPLPYFVLDVEASVISSHLTKLNLFLHCLNDLNLFIENFSLSLLVLCFFRDLICCLLQSVFGPLHNLSGIGVREDEKDRERGQTINGRWEEPLGAQVERCSNRYVISIFSFYSLVIQHYHDMALYLTMMARVKWRPTSRDAMILLHHGPIASLSIQSEMCCTFSGRAE